MIIVLQKCCHVGISENPPAKKNMKERNNSMTILPSFFSNGSLSVLQYEIGEMDELEGIKG